MRELSLDGQSLSLNDIINVAHNIVNVSISDNCKHKVTSSVNYLQQVVVSNELIYGVTTNFGGMAKEGINSEYAGLLQSTLLWGLKCSIGKPLAVAHIRAAMLIAANSLLKGVSGIRYELIERIVAFLNAQFTPIIYDHGSIGASGDLVPMSYIAGCITGLSESYKVLTADNQEIDALTALKKLNKPPISLQAKEGLAIANSTAMMTAIASNSIAKATFLFDLALNIHTFFMQALQANLQSLDEFVHEHKPHRGQILVAAKMRSLLAGSQFVDSQQKIGTCLVQDRYSIRCLAQYLGAITDGLLTIQQQVEVEANSVTDNPLIDVINQRMLHSGNFLGQYISVGMDQLRYYLGLLVKHLDVQIALLVAPEFNRGLPASLAAANDSSVKFGLKGLQICANSIMPVILHQANPIATLFPTHAEQFNQNINSQGFASANLAWQTLDSVSWYLAIALIFAVQSVELRCYQQYGHYDASTYLSFTAKNLYELIYQLLEQKLERNKALVYSNHDTSLDNYIKKIYEDLLRPDGKIRNTLSMTSE